MKKIIALNLIACMLMLIFAGCLKNSDYDVKSVELEIKGTYNPVHEVIIIASDRKIVYYDFTSYSWNSNWTFDYYTDTLPPESEYEKYEGEISDEDWNNLLATINSCNFMELPEDISAGVDVMDAPDTHITVITSEDSHTCGGYGAGYNDNTNNKKYSIVYDAISECRSNSIHN